MLNARRYIFGLDFHILATLLFRGWAVIAGGVTILLLPLYLSPSEQGYYFTFAELLAVIGLDVAEIVELADVLEVFEGES